MAKKQGLAKYFESSYWSSDLLVKQLPMILFLGFLALVYIANARYAERNVRRIQMVKREIQELRWQYMSLQAEIMYNTKQSEMEDQVRAQGLRAVTTDRKRIVISK